MITSTWETKNIRQSHVNFINLHFTSCECVFKAWSAASHAANSLMLLIMTERDVHFISSTLNRCGQQGGQAFFQDEQMWQFFFLHESFITPSWQLILTSIQLTSSLGFFPQIKKNNSFWNYIMNNMKSTLLQGGVNKVILHLYKLLVTEINIHLLYIYNHKTNTVSE